MEGQEALRITVLNRNYPPGHGITGESAAELAAFLMLKGLEVTVVHVKTHCSGSHNELKRPGNVLKIRTFYNGKRKFPRLLANLYEGFQLVRKARKLNSNIIICMTDPPLLNFWVALLLNKRQKWVLWSMDLYPEAFVSGKLVTKKNIFYRLIDSVLLKYPPCHIISLGTYQADCLQKKFKNTISYTLLPCGIYNKYENINRNGSRPPWAADKSKIYLGYCGNIGEAHSKEFIFSILDHLDPSRYTLILALYGTKAAKILEYAQQRTGVVVVDTVQRGELKYIDIHLASLVKDWVNVSVPSKTVSSVCAGSTFLYNGSSQSDNWALLKEAGWIIEGNNTDEAVKSFFKKLTREEVLEKKLAAVQLAQLLNEMKSDAFNNIYRKITSLCVYNVKAYRNNYKDGSLCCKNN